MNAQAMHAGERKPPSSVSLPPALPLLPFHVSRLASTRPISAIREIHVGGTVCARQGGAYLDGAMQAGAAKRRRTERAEMPAAAGGFCFSLRLLLW